VALSLTAIGCMGLIAAYQIGFLKRLPDLPLPLMDAEKVDASEEAYAKLQTPDAFIGRGSYATTMGLAAMGGKDRANEQPWIPLALAAKATVDAAQAAKLTCDHWAKHKAFCVWCLVAASATFATVPLVMGEAAAAVRTLAGAAARDPVTASGRSSRARIGCSC
jgi:hypothetical protein